MIIGIGTDITELARIKASYDRFGERFLQKILTPDELKLVPESPIAYISGRFAAKEAAVKALGTGFTRGIGVRDIEVRRNAKGRPSVVLSGRAKEVAAEQVVRELPLSLSFTHTDAVACAMAITEDSLRAAEKRVDPMEELSRQFKEARSLLDDMDAPPDAPAGAASGTPGR